MSVNRSGVDSGWWLPSHKKEPVYVLLEATKSGTPFPPVPPTVVEVGVGVKAARFAAKGVRMRQNKNQDVTCTQAASRAWCIFSGREALVAMERALRSTICISSKFFTARAGFRLALVSFRTRAKRGIAETGGGPNRARAPPAVARNRRVCG